MKLLRILVFILLAWVATSPIAFAQDWISGGQFEALKNEPAETFSTRLHEVLPKHVASLLERGSAVVGEGKCFEMFGPYYSLRAGSERAAGNLYDMRSQAVVAALGTVVGIDEGIYGNAFGLRVTLSIKKALGLESRDINGDLLDLFYPKGRIRFGVHCVEMMNPELPDPPSVGDEMMAVSLVEPDELISKGLLVLYHDAVFIQREGAQAITGGQRWLYDEEIAAATDLESLASLTNLFGGDIR